ncbi:MAG: oligosaccharide flippase family protein [Ignavibacteriales bacterium]|nr:oligosaccharide flippase family protein [Ignavibacteriales bacterium]
MRRETLLNAFSGPAHILVNILLVLVLIPLFIDTLGLRLYGVYALVSVVGSLGVFTNFGFNTSLIKYLAEQKNREQSNYDIVVTLILLAGTTSLAGLLAILFGDFFLMRVLGIDEALVDSSVRWFYYTSVGASIVQVVGQVPGAVLDAQQKVYVTNSVTMGAGAMGRIAVIGSLFLHPDLATIGWIMLGSAVAGTFFLTWFAYKTWGAITSPGLKSHVVPVARKHFVYARSIYATAVVGSFYEPLTKVLLSHYVGLTEVGFFDIALRIKTLVWSLLERFLYPVLPMLASKSSFDEVRSLVNEAQQKLLLIVVPILVAVPFLAAPVVSVWLGNVLLPVVLGVACVLCCYLFALLFLPVYQFLTIKGHPEKTFVLQLTNAGVNLVLFAGLVPLFGYYGALAAFCLAVLTSSALCIKYQRTFLGNQILGSRILRLRVLTLMAGLLLVNALVSAIAEGDWVRIAVQLTANVVATIALFRQLKMITADDLNRYVGRQSRLGTMLERVLVRGT